MNPEIDITVHCDKIANENMDSLVGDADIIIDCMDNFTTRYLLNNCAIAKNIPLVFGSIWGIDGRLAFIRSPETPCLRCIFPEALPNEVFSCWVRQASVIGSLQVLEAVKHLSGTGSTLKGEILVWEGGANGFHKFKTRKDLTCSAGGGK